MIWILITLLFSLAIYVWVWPYITNKIILYRLYLKLKKIAKKDPTLQILAEDAYKLYKNYKIDSKL